VSMRERIAPLSFDIPTYLALLHAEIARFIPSKGLRHCSSNPDLATVPRYRDALSFGARTFLCDAISITAAILTCFF